MAAARKRCSDEIEVEGAEAQSQRQLIRLRNMWQFANLSQWIYLFGKALKIDDTLEIDDLEIECQKPQSTTLADVGLALLKCITNHRGLTHDVFDSYARAQYAKNADGSETSPFGTEAAPKAFGNFDVFTKIRVLQQFTQWAMIHPERIRDKMDEQKDTDQANWRMEPYGWDSEDRTYFVLDDNRVYRLTDAPPPQPRQKSRPKKTVKSYRTGKRSSKRRRTSAGIASVDSPDHNETHQTLDEEIGQDDGLGGRKWECIAVTLADVQRFLHTIQRSRDENEKILRRQLEEHLVPILERQDEARARKQRQKEKELLNELKMANAKRSSRIAYKIEQQKEEEKNREEELRRRADEMVKKREDVELFRYEKERDARINSRALRRQEREARKFHLEEELSNLSEGSGAIRISERQRKAMAERAQQEMQELVEEEEEDWFFDCICGVHGHGVDDGTHSIACEKCNIWQHSKCAGIPQEEADQDTFRFVCDSCRRRESRPKIKLKVNPSGHSQTTKAQAPSAHSSGHSPKLVVEIPRAKSSSAQPIDHLQSSFPGPTATTLDRSLDLGMASAHRPGVNGITCHDSSPPRRTDDPALPSQHPPQAPPSQQTPTTITAIPVDLPGVPSRPTQHLHVAPDAVTLVAGWVQQQQALAEPAYPSKPPADASLAHHKTHPESVHSMLSTAGEPTANTCQPTFKTPSTSNFQASPPSRSASIMFHGTQNLAPVLIEGGISPTKTSPPLAQSHQFGFKVNTASSILPPIAALTPPSRPQILAAPTKHSGQAPGSYPGNQ